MKLSEVKKSLETAGAVKFLLPDGTIVPEHFHLTEVGVVTKHFIDCGGTVRNEKVANFQLWKANDLDHRLTPEKFLKILSISEKITGKENLDVEVEYQSGTIGKYGLEFNGTEFVLTVKQTDCLAKDNCGVPESGQKAKLVEVGAEKASCCTPGGGCC